MVLHISYQHIFKNKKKSGGGWCNKLLVKINGPRMKEKVAEKYKRRNSLWDPGFAAV